MSLPDSVHQYQTEHLNDTYAQTVAEIKTVLESDIKPLAMLAAIALIMHPRLAANPTVSQYGPADFQLHNLAPETAPHDQHGPTMFEMK